MLICCGEELGKYIVSHASALFVTTHGWVMNVANATICCGASVAYGTRDPLWSNQYIFFVSADLFTNDIEAGVFVPSDFKLPSSLHGSVLASAVCGLIVVRFSS
jgi:hypothetical protein